MHFLNAAVKNVHIIIESLHTFKLLMSVVLVGLNSFRSRFPELRNSGETCLNTNTRTHTSGDMLNSKITMPFKYYTSLQRSI